MPFWFWNGRQTEAEITRQIALAADGGLRGLAIHARAGNQVPYLSDAWMSLVRHACAEARDRGLEIWIYDEDGYPSGTVSNRIQAQRPDLTQTYLAFRYTTAEQARQEPRAVRVFAAADLGRPVDPAELPPKTEVLLFTSCTVGRYVDTLRPETAELFLALTHERYRAVLGEFFGNPVTAFYTDDVNYLMEFAGGLPYTPGLEAAFQERFGAGLLNRLPLLVEDLPGSGELRIQYRALLQELFLRHFVRPVNDWCRRHGLFLTGHLRGDEGPFARSVNQFSSAMPFHAAEAVPGIDDYLLHLMDGRYAAHLQNHLGLYPLITYKQAASVANQFKGGRCGSECLASLGWGFSLEEFSRQLRFELFMGMNLLSPHACSYSTAGVAKFDHPPSYFFQQPWWPMMPEVLKPLGRLSGLLQRGRYAADVLVLHPATSAWMTVNGADLNAGFTPRMTAANRVAPGALERAFAELTMELLRRHVGCDYGDEELLAEPGNAAVSRAGLTVGAMTYRTVVIPPVLTIRDSTRTLLRNFLDQGGRVILLVPDPRWNALPELGAAVLRTGAGWRETLAGLLIPDLALTDADGGALPEVAVHARSVDGRREFNLLNLQPEAVSVRLPKAAAEGLELFDPELDTACGSAAAFTLPPFACAHLRPAASAGATAAPAARESLLPARTLPSELAAIPTTAWEVTALEDNVLHLDGAWLDSAEPASLRELGGSVPCPENLELRLDLPRGVAITRLASEQLRDCRVTVNDLPLPDEGAAKLPMSPDLHAVSIRNRFRDGLNRIGIQLPHPPPARIEDFYLFGAFGVRFHEDSVRGWIPRLEPPPVLALGNLTEQGLPFYWGTVRYRTTLKLPAGARPGWLDLGKVVGAVRVFLNGAELPLRTGPPWRYFIAERMRSGENPVEILLANTPQNFFGAHRWSGFHPPRTRPEADAAGSCLPGIPYRIMCFGLHGPIRVLTEA